MSSEVDREYGRLMEQVRKDRELSQFELAKLMGTYQTRLSRWEQGLIRISAPDFANWADKVSLTESEWTTFRALGVIAA